MNINSKNNEEQDLRKYDIYWIFYGFSNEEIINNLISYLYFSKRDISLSFLIWWNLSEEEYEKIKDDDEKLIVSTLSYIYPILKEGKLKLMIRYIFCSKEEVNKEMKKIKHAWIKRKMIEMLHSDNLDWWKKVVLQYYSQSEETEDSLFEIKRRWIEIKDRQERINFNDFSVLFILPENDWWIWWNKSYYNGQ